MSNNESQQLIERVTLELQEMKKLGMRVPFDPSKFTDAQKAEIVEYRDGGLSISDIADLLINLS